MRRHRLVAVLLAGGLGPLVAVPSPAPAEPPDPGLSRWVRPVDGPVTRPFQEPTHRFGPGHRGADLAAPAGTVVRAANAGVVSFAGSVAGTLHVVVAHEGGLRTSYSFLARVDVRGGQRVGPGQPVGVTGGGGADHSPGVLHLGLRVGDRYVDPMLLFEAADLTRLVRLVPTDLPPARPWVSARQQAIRDIREQLASDGGGRSLFERGVDAVVDAGSSAIEAGGRAAGGVASAAGATVDQLAELGGGVGRGIGRLAAGVATRLPATRMVRDFAEVAQRTMAWWAARRDCSADSPPAEGEGGSGHLLLAVGGINSHGGPDQPTSSLDTAALGYHEDEVTYFSYDPDGGSYSKADTWGDLLAAGRNLAEQLKELHAREPGREVDLIAHSQGGVVVDVFLQHFYDAADPDYPPIGTVVTLASPHEGAPLATSAQQVRRTRTGRAATDVAGRVLPFPPAGGASTRQVAEGSRFLRDLWRHRLPDHIDFTTIGGSDDLVVPATQIEVPGATEVVVTVDGANDHSAIPTDDRALQVVRGALEGRPPPCVGAVEGLRGAIEPVAITRTEHAIGDAGRAVLP